MAAFIRSTSRFAPSLYQNSIRSFSVASPIRKSATETAKDALKTADKVVSDTIVKGMDKTGTFHAIVTHIHH